MTAMIRNESMKCVCVSVSEGKNHCFSRAPKGPVQIDSPGAPYREKEDQWKSLTIHV